MTQIWKIPINPQRPPDFLRDPANLAMFEPGKAEKAKAFCFEKGWVGIGWGLSSIKCNLSNYREYLRVLDKSSQDEIGFSPKYARGPCIAFAETMQNGDFIWCRAAGDIYYLGRVKGTWAYKHSGEFHRLDLYQVRKCRWERAGPSDRVPGPVKNAFAGRGQAISRIKKDWNAAIRGTAAIWQSLTQEKIELEFSPVVEFPLSAIAHDDLEDIVALYVQMELGWHIIPSTVKRSTPDTEFVLRNPSGRRAYAQVKTHPFAISEIVVPVEVDEFFVFYPQINLAEKRSNIDRRIKLIDPSALAVFVKANQNLMPPIVKQLMELITTHPPSARR